MSGSPRSARRGNLRRLRGVVLRWLEKNEHRPFFIFVNYMEAHHPYAPPYPYDRRWAGGEASRKFFDSEDIWREFSYSVNSGKRKVSEEERRYLLGKYDGEIAYLDSQIGIFLSELKRLGLYDDSLIVLTSDHGEHFAEHGLIQHPHVLYQELIRVPLIVKPPARGNETPSEISGAVSIVDLFHSILSYIGIPHETRQGSSNIFETAGMPVFSETHSMPGEGIPEFEERFGTHLYSIIRNNYKLIYSSEKGYEFYSLSNDTSESLNIMEVARSEELEAELARMKADLDLHIERINMNRLESVELPPEEQEAIRANLKALGYIQ